MELFESGKILWRRRYIVLIALVVALLGGVLLTFHVSPGFPPTLASRVHTSGEASAQVLVDTPRSQIADLNPTGAPYVYERASLLSNVMATAPVQEQLAEQLKLVPGELSVTPPTASIIAPIKATGLATAGTALTAVKPTWNLAITIDPNLPLLNFTATAPTAADAQALALGAISLLRTQVGGLASREDVPAGERVVVNTIGPPVPTAVVKGFRKAYGFAVTVVLFLAECFLIVIWDRRRKRDDRQPQSYETWSEDEITIKLAQRALHDPFVRTFKIRQVTSVSAPWPDDVVTVAADATPLLQPSSSESARTFDDEESSHETSSAETRGDEQPTEPVSETPPV